MNFIQKYSFKKSVSRFIALKNKEKICVCSLEEAHSVGILYTFESPEALEQLLKSVQVLRKNKDTVVVYCYISKEQKISINHKEECVFISEKDFNFVGVLKKEMLGLIQKHSFDILINLNRKDTLISVYLAGKIKAKFRIGRCDESKEYCDIVIYSSNENYSMEEYFHSINEYSKKITCQ